jgi:hypothetical protein
MKIKQRINLEFLVKLKNKRFRKEEMIRALEDTNDIVFFDNKGVIMSA